MPACETTEQSLAQEEDWASRSVAYLKTLIPAYPPQK